MHTLRKRLTAAGWLILACIAFVLFLFLTVLYVSHVLLYPTLLTEQWLLWRPVTKLDCTFFEWRHLGEVPAMFAGTIVLGVISVLVGQPRRILLYLILIFMIGVAVELLGKEAIRIPLPNTLRSGMTVLTCPQMDNQPFSAHLAAAVGIAGRVAEPPPVQVSWAHTVAQMPLASMKTTENQRSFPGGHAMRWCFVCLTAAWICWRYIRMRWLAIFLAILLSLLAFFGGFMQFYIGSHLISDTLGGYLFGIASAGCAIALLVIHDTKPRVNLVHTNPVSTHHGDSYSQKNLLKEGTRDTNW